MIYLTSDLHGGQDLKGLEQFLSVRKSEDWLFILGDLELRFRDTEENKKFSDFFEALQCNIAFIDGNHENFNYLYSLPEEDWNGGRIHRVSDRIVHLMRGHIFNIEGKSFLTMGGCASSQRWKDWGLWWPQEDPTADEIRLAYQNLEQHKHRVDYVLTHKYRKEGVELSPDMDLFSLNGFMYYVEQKVSFQHWYAGHWHKNKSIDPKHTLVFNELIHI